MEGLFDSSVVSVWKWCSVDVWVTLFCNFCFEGCMFSTFICLGCIFLFMKAVCCRVLFHCTVVSLLFASVLQGFVLEAMRCECLSGRSSGLCACVSVAVALLTVAPWLPG